MSNWNWSNWAGCGALLAVDAIVMACAWMLFKDARKALDALEVPNNYLRFFFLIK
jgi:hypothetical protein